MEGGQAIYSDDTQQKEVNRMAQEWENSLTHEEKEALRRWGISGSPIRKLQNGNIDGLSPEELRIAQIDLEHWQSALNKGVRYNGRVYRGLSDVPYENGIEDWISDGYIQLANDQSATLDSIVAEKFRTYGYGNQNGMLLEIEQNSGVSLFGTTQVTMGGKPIGESEVVLRLNTKYKIIDTQFITEKGNLFPPPDYFEGTDYSWPNNPPPGWWPGKDVKGFWKLILGEL